MSATALQQAALNFANALCALIVACFRFRESDDETKEDAPSTKNEKKAKWPSSFGAWVKQWNENSEQAQGFVGEILRNVSAIKWAPEKIDLMWCGAPDMEEQATSDDSASLVRNVFASNLGFTGDLVLRGNTNVGPKVETSAPPAKKGRPKKEAAAPAEKAAEVTFDDVNAAAKELAEKLGERETVRAIIAKFGSPKIAENDPKKFPAILEALKNYSETTTDDTNDF